MAPKSFRKSDLISKMKNLIAPTRRREMSVKISKVEAFPVKYQEPNDSMAWRADWGFLSQLAALTLHSVIAPNLERDILLKWPNDILIEEKKVAGLLAQATDKGVVIGIGLNVSMTISELPIPHATSIAISGGKELDRNLLLANFLNTFQANFQDWDNGASFITKYTSICSTIGQEVEIEVLGRENRQGRAQGILNSGALLLADGFAVTVGDVVHLR